jgi:8-oxo-dGTP pyrophosphatase MutT (NUDIX family)
MTIARLRAGLLGAATGGYQGDWDVNQDGRPDVTGMLAPAAVLIAVSDEARPQLILTRRPMTMTRHPGQIAFPGGRVDDGDADAIATALREAEEEVALAPELVEVLGIMAPYATGTGFVITPVVGLVPPDVALVPHEREVAEVFRVPFDHVIDPANQQRRTGEWQGRRRDFYVIQAGNREIWGATAGILVNLSRQLP